MFTAEDDTFNTGDCHCDVAARCAKPQRGRRCGRQPRDDDGRNRAGLQNRNGGQPGQARAQPNLSGPPTFPDVFGTEARSCRLSGAATSTCAWCESLAKAKSALEVPRVYSNPVQDGPRYFCSRTTVTPSLQRSSVASADHDVRDLGHVSGSRLSDDDWRIASPGISSRGVGSGATAGHAPVADVPSFSACIDFRSRMCFDPLDTDGGSLLVATEDNLKAALPPGADMYDEPNAPSQSVRKNTLRVFDCPPCPDTATLTLGPLASKALPRGATPWTGSRTTTQSFRPSDFPNCLWNGPGASDSSVLGTSLLSANVSPAKTGPPGCSVTGRP